MQTYTISSLATFTRWRFSLHASIGLATLLGCTPESDAYAPEQALPALRQEDEVTRKHKRHETFVADTRGALAEGRPAEVLVLVRTATTEPAAAFGALQADAAVSADLETIFEAVLSEVGPVEDGGYERLSELHHIPVLPLRLHTEEALEKLIENPDVVTLAPNVAHEPTLTRSLALIGAPQAASAGHRGEGTTIAVLDTGVDFTHSTFGCTAANTPAACKVVYAKDFAKDDGVLDATTRHGTNVAAIALGVAPSARILALDVFDGTVAYTSDILAALDWVIANRIKYNIAAINMRLGAGNYGSPCGTEPLAIAVKSARAANILTTIAAGNSAYTSGISSPACAPEAISVGAVYDAAVGSVQWTACSDQTTAADRVACFSNSASFMTMLAPGALITAGGVTMGGTSQAAPHVAGAVAVLRGAFPGESTASIYTRLISSSVTITDSRNGVASPRLDLPSALAPCVDSLTPTSIAVDDRQQTALIHVKTNRECSWMGSTTASHLTIEDSAGTGTKTVMVKIGRNTGEQRSGNIAIAGKTVTIVQSANAPPVGTVSVNAGSDATNTTAVTLQTTATDLDGIASICLSANTTCTNYVPFSTSQSFELTNGTGVKTVYAFVRDTTGRSSMFSDSILLDQTLPVDGTLDIREVDGVRVASWSGFTDKHSGLAGYKLVYAPQTAPMSCTTGAEAYRGTSTRAPLNMLPQGVYGFRLCAIDKAGNLSAGATAKTLPEYQPPSKARVLINQGATYTNRSSVDLTLSASDQAGVTHMCLSANSACSQWVPFATNKSFTLKSGTGVRTVYAFFRDSYGNATAAPAADSIIVDASAPTNVKVTVKVYRATQRLTLSWNAASDAHSGLAGYQVVRSSTAMPANCQAGTLVYKGNAQTLVDAAIKSKTRMFYRVCPYDVLGNMATGTAATATLSNKR